MDLNFFKKDAEIVAKELLGKILIRNINGKQKIAKIVETEAYFDESDPASRACKNGDLRETMKMKAGTILVFGVHNNWLFNLITGKEGCAEAVLLRALEPLNFKENCRGPGLLTKAMLIDKSFHKKHIFNMPGLKITDKNARDKNRTSLEISESFRIGVKKDLPKKLRFYVKGSKHISRI
jgi:DNA-3-methyladenine glycosylase